MKKLRVLGPVGFLAFACVPVMLLGAVALSLTLPGQPLDSQAGTLQPSIPAPSLPVRTVTTMPVPPTLQAPAQVLTPTAPHWAPLPPLTGEQQRGLITNGDRSEKYVALTFDLCQLAGDLAGYDGEIVRILNEMKAPATFFAGGLWMRDHPSETLSLAANPLFEMGNHSWSHADFAAIPGADMEQEILLAQQMMYELLGYQARLFRLPYGTYTDEALEVINDHGLYIIQWDDVSGDPDPNIDAAEMTGWVLQQAQPGSIIIMHANGRGWHTAEALPGIIRSLRERELTLATVSELLHIHPYE